MAATASTYQLTVHVLTGDGIGGYWWISKDSNDFAYQINYAVANAVVESAAPLYHADTFADLLTSMVTQNIDVSTVEFKINVEKVSDKNSLSAQFNAPLLTNAQLQQIVNNFDHVNLVKKLGVYRLVQRFYLQGHFTLLELQDVLIYLGINGKVDKQKIEPDIDWLLNNSHITQAQYDTFWDNWNTQVEGQ